MDERALLVGVDATTSRILRQLLAEAGLDAVESHPAAPEPSRRAGGTLVFVGAAAAGQVSQHLQPGGLATLVFVADREDLGQAAAALRAGAHDCLLVPLAELELARAAIRRALERERLLARVRISAAEIEHHREQLEGLGFELAELANRDVLTGVYNRRYLREAIEQELGRSRRNGHPFSLVALEIEGLGDYNESHGRLAAAELLRTVARLLETRCRATSTLARFGDGTFVLVLPEVSADGAASFACTLRDAVAAHAFPGAANVPLSAGVATYPEAGDEAALLIERVERALERARCGGPNRVALWAPFAAATA